MRELSELMKDRGSGLKELKVTMNNYSVGTLARAYKEPSELTLDDNRYTQYAADIPHLMMYTARLIYPATVERKTIK